MREEIDHPSTPRRSVAAAGAGAILLLVIVSRFIALDHVYVRGLNGYLNDQISYISVARTFAASGHLANTSVYPSTLLQPTPKNYFYMPGQYLLLAAVFKALGYSAFHAFIPGLVSFIVCVCLTYTIAWRLYGRTAATSAALLFALFPLNIILAFSAMCEIPLTAATLAAFAGFLFMPERLRPYIGPLLIVLPMLVRETGAVVAIPMFFLLLSPDSRPVARRIARGAVFAVLTLAVSFLMITNSLFAGRPSLLLNNLSDRSFSSIYTDAFATRGVDASRGAVLRLIARKFTANVDALFHPGHLAVPVGQQVAMFLILVSIPVGLILMVHRRDFFAGGVSAAVLALLVADLALYTVWQYRGVRALLLMQPFAMIVIASLFSGAPITAGERRSRWFLQGGGIALYLIYSALHLVSTYAPQRALNAAGDRETAVIEALHHDDRTLLVGPYWFGAEYVLKHYPVPSSFIPANLGTLRLLEQRYRVGTILYPLLPEPLRRAQGQLSVAELQNDGWRPERAIGWNGITFLIYRGRDRTTATTHEGPEAGARPPAPR